MDFSQSLRLIAPEFILSVGGLVLLLGGLHGVLQRLLVVGFVDGIFLVDRGTGVV